jgi:hypothetical protein
VVLALDQKGGDVVYVTYEGLFALAAFILGIIALCAKLFKK